MGMKRERDMKESRRRQSLLQLAPGYRILGIDPGTRILGYAVLELDRKLQPAVLSHGVCRLSSKMNVSQRLKEIYMALKDFMEELRPDVVVVEEVFYGKNVQSALRIGESRGVVFVAAAMAGRQVVEYSPASVKQAVCGNGRAPKVQIQQLVQRLLKLEKIPETSDAADALAIAFCHVQRLRASCIRPTPKRKKSASKGKVTRKSLQVLLDRINVKR